jgi:hypothetical protein
VTSLAKLRTRLADLTAFVDALNALLEVCEPRQMTYSGPATFVPKEGQESEAIRRRFEVDRIAGRAAYAYAEAGSIIDWKPRGTMQTQPVNPATVWGTILDPDPIVPVSLILACAAQATGILEMRIEQAEEEERNPPPPPPRPPRQSRLRWSHLAPVVKWVGGIAGAVIVAGLTYLLGWR